MHKKVLNFIEKHRIAVLTTINNGNAPHSASMHYAFSSKDLSFIFITEKGSRKLFGLSETKSLSSVVIGFSEEEWIELQMEGEIKIVTHKNEWDSAWKIYGDKFVGMEKYKNSKSSVILLFKPTWWRYTEFKAKPRKIILSGS